MSDLNSLIDLIPEDKRGEAEKLLKEQKEGFQKAIQEKDKLVSEALEGRKKAREKNGKILEKLGIEKDVEDLEKELSNYTRKEKKEEKEKETELPEDYEQLKRERERLLELNNESEKKRKELEQKIFTDNIKIEVQSACIQNNVKKGGMRYVTADVMNMAKRDENGNIVFYDKNNNVIYGEGMKPASASEVVSILRENARKNNEDLFFDFTPQSVGDGRVPENAGGMGGNGGNSFGSSYSVKK